MGKIINVSIDLAKIDKTKIKEVKLKNGNTAKFLDITISVNDDKDKYGNDTSVSISQTKEERADKKDKVYLGNGKTVWSSEAGNAPEPSSNNKNSGDDLPF